VASHLFFVEIRGSLTKSPELFIINIEESLDS